jgi:hypothetical protein
MARWSKTLTIEAQAAFLSALRGGALVEAAARDAGVAVSTLYWRRKRDKLFAMMWEAAASLSAEAPGRRRPFEAQRRALFLTAFEKSCNLRDACARTGVDPATVYRHIAGDPEFEQGCRGALERGSEALEREAERQRLASARGMIAHEIEPKGVMTRDFEEIMKLLARYERKDGSIGCRFVRHGRQRRWSFDDAITLLAQRLERMKPGWGRSNARRKKGKQD